MADDWGRDWPPRNPTRLTVCVQIDGRQYSLACQAVERIAYRRKPGWLGLRRQRRGWAAPYRPKPLTEWERRSILILGRGIGRYPALPGFIISTGV